MHEIVQKKHARYTWVGSGSIQPGSDPSHNRLSRMSCSKPLPPGWTKRGVALTRKESELLQTWGCPREVWGSHSIDYHSANICIRQYDAKKIDALWNCEVACVGLLSPNFTRRAATKSQYLRLCSLEQILVSNCPSCASSGFEVLGCLLRWKSYLDHVAWWTQEISDGIMNYHELSQVWPCTSLAHDQRLKAATTRRRLPLSLLHTMDPPQKHDQIGGIQLHHHA